MALTFVVILLFCMSLGHLAGTGHYAFAATVFSEQAEMPIIETYQYESLPQGGGDGDKESVSMKYATTSNEVRCSSVSISRDYTVRVEIAMHLDGSIISATKKTFSNRSNALESEYLIRQNGRVITVEQTAGGKNESRSHLIPNGQNRAVDLSLLYLLRSFPFSKNEQWRVFMADFSGHFITVAVRDTGVERITVPAGTFDCYRVVATVSFLFLKAEIVYWLKTSPPHFLVKHEGKRGPFTRSYTTMLISRPCP